jgi:hypothetical protein
MGLVRVELIDKGTAINAYGVVLSGNETQDVELTEGVKALRLSGLIVYTEIPDIVEEKPKTKK